MSSATSNLQLEMRQTAALALTLNAITLGYAAPIVARFINPGQDWNGSSTAFPPWLLMVSHLLQVVFAVVNIPISVRILVLDKMPSPGVAIVALFLTLLVWIPFLSVISAQIFNCYHFPTTGASGYLSVQDYEPTHSEIRVLTTLWIFTLYAYAGSTIGALTFFQWKIWNFSRGVGAATYGRSYYDSRQLYYGFLVLLAGIMQVAVGGYVLGRFGDGPQLPSPILINVFTVTCPELSITVGLLTIFFAFLVLHRGHHRSSQEGQNVIPHWLADETFDGLAWALFVLSIGMQVLGQVGPAAPSYAARANEAINVFALLLMPVYLDMKARMTPHDVRAYFDPMGISEKEKALPAVAEEEDHSSTDNA